MNRNITSSLGANTRDFSKGKSFRYKGTWSSAEHYVNDEYFQDFVSYQGKLYGCIQTNVGISPSLVSYWKFVLEGQPGPSILLQVITDADGNKILQKRYSDDEPWQPFFDLEGLRGRNGHSIIIEKNPTSGDIEYRYENETPFDNKILIPNSDIETNGGTIVRSYIGDDGYLYIQTSNQTYPQRIGYARGDKGKDGRNIVIRVDSDQNLDEGESGTGTHLQWKYGGDEYKLWHNLIQINDLMNIAQAGLKLESEIVQHPDEQGVMTTYNRLMLSSWKTAYDTDGNLILTEKINTISVVDTPIPNLLIDVYYDDVTGEIVFVFQTATGTEEIRVPGVINYEAGDGIEITVDHIIKIADKGIVESMLSDALLEKIDNKIDDVPELPADALYLRKRGEWDQYVPIDAYTKTETNNLLEDYKPKSTVTWYVDKSSTKTKEDGSLSYPYKEIQTAVNAATGGVVIKVASGTYAPVTVNKSFISIIGEGNLGQPRTTISGALTISGIADSFGIANMVVTGLTTKSSTNSTWYPDNCAFQGGVTMSGTGYVRMDFCTYRGLLQHNNVAFMDLFNCQAEQFAAITMTNNGTPTTKRLYLQDCLNVYVTNHAGATLIADGGTNFIAPTIVTPCLTSTATSANGALYLLGGTTFNGTQYYKINKTGNCVWSTGIFLHEPTIDVFTGTEIPAGLHDVDIWSHRTATNYTPTNAKLQGHLQGIDNALGNIVSDAIEDVPDTDPNALYVRKHGEWVLTDTIEIEVDGGEY